MSSKDGCLILCQAIFDIDKPNVGIINNARAVLKLFEAVAKRERYSLEGVILAAVEALMRLDASVV